MINKTGEELINSITESTTVEEFELLFVQLSNHLSWFKNENNLTDGQLDSLLTKVLESVRGRIDSLGDEAAPVRLRFEAALANARGFSGPSRIN